MRSQIRFVMHPLDEADFIAQVLLDADVGLIDGPRWPAEVPQVTRSLAQIKGRYCIIWSSVDRAVLTARFVPTCNDWYCNSEGATLQLLRSTQKDAVLLEGRIAIGTTGENAEESAGVERRFKALQRFIKKNFTNSALVWRNARAPANPAGQSLPDKQLWVGPHALSWLQQDPVRCAKQEMRAFGEARPAQYSADLS